MNKLISLLYSFAQAQRLNKLIRILDDITDGFWFSLMHWGQGFYMMDLVRTDFFLIGTFDAELFKFLITAVDAGRSMWVGKGKKSGIFHAISSQHKYQF